MKLGTQVGLSPGHNVLDEDPAPSSSKGHSPSQFSALCCGQMAEWIKMSLGREIGLDPSDIVLDGGPLPSRKGAESLNFRPMYIVP